MNFEWLAILIFIAILIAASAAETWWLTRNEWADASRAVLYVVTTNLLGLGVGSLIIFAIAMIVFMMVMGRSGEGGTSPEWMYWAVLGGGAAAAISFLFFIKRAFLRLFNIRHGKAAWIYSVVISILILICISAPIGAAISYSVIRN